MLNAEKFLTERDREIFKLAGFGKRFELGKKPLFLIIDVTYEFTGAEREPLLEAAKKIWTACGEEAWQAVDCIQRMLKVAREKNIPIAYTLRDKETNIEWVYNKKNSRSAETHDDTLGRIVDEITPQEGDYIIKKITPSAFFGTYLAHLIGSKQIDTVVIVGGVISGCVRATATDAFAYGHKVAVVRDGVFDRGEASGAMSLFDLGAKYANILSESEAIDYFANL